MLSINSCREYVSIFGYLCNCESISFDMVVFFHFLFSLINNSASPVTLSSIVIILYFLMISIMQPDKNEDLPALLVPAINIVLVPSIRKLINPAANGLIILYFMKSGRVHGLSLCFLNEKASPVGFNGCVITATLVDA